MSLSWRTEFWRETESKPIMCTENGCERGADGGDGGGGAVVVDDGDGDDDDDDDGGDDDDDDDDDEDDDDDNDPSVSFQISSFFAANSGGRYGK